MHMPSNALPQIASDTIHAVVVIICVVCATVLAAVGALDRNTVGNVYLAAVGYAAGRAGSVAHRAFELRGGRRTEDQGKIDVTS